MSLPNLPAGDKFRREVRTEWGGLNLNENAGDGELIEAMNMSSREFPVLSTEQLSKAQATTAMDAIYSYAGKLGYEFDTGGTVFLYDPTRGDTASIGNQLTRQFAALGEKMILLGKALPGVESTKKIYDFSTGSVSNMETGWSSCAYFDNGTIDGVAAEANTIKGTEIGSGFRPGDAVTISGCSAVPENNKTVIVREVDTDELRFYENTFTLGGNKYVYTATGAVATGKYCIKTDSGGYSFMLGLALANGDTVTFDYDVYQGGPGFVYTSGGSAVVAPASEDLESATELAFELVDSTDPGHTEVSITVSRTVPDMDFICVNENRVWGCKGDTIYASKLGDPLNWNVFDGLSTDSWTAETGTQGDFTGCCSFQGYPTFFKENAVFKVLGDEPSNFTLRRINIVGVEKYGDKTIVEIRGRLYYKSVSGIMEWNGGDYPVCVSDALGRMIGQLGGGTSAAGTDSVRYFIELQPNQYEREVGWWVQKPGVYVYDPRFGTWHMLGIFNERITPVMFAGDGVHNWMVKDWHKPSELSTVFVPYIYTLHSFKHLEDETIPWIVTFADSTRAYKTALAGSESKKGVLRLLIRCRLAGSMKVWIAYDGGNFEEAGEFGGETGMAKGSRVVPLILRRCDFWQLRLTGTGDAVIYSIAVERYGGEWQQA